MEGQRYSTAQYNSTTSIDIDIDSCIFPIVGVADGFFILIVSLGRTLFDRRGGAEDQRREGLELAWIT
jgi:hypothetical protein